MEQKDTSGKNVRWDLSVMYGGLDDPRLDEDRKELISRAKIFRDLYKGALGKTLGNALVDYTEIGILVGKIMAFLSLFESTDVTNAAVKTKLAEVEQEISALQGNFLTFFELELVKLKDEVLEKWYAENELMRKHRPWIEHIRIFKEHFLEEAVESALAKRTPFGPGTWSQFFDEFEADLEFEFGGEKKTLTEMLHLLGESKNAEERRIIQKITNEGLKGAFSKYSAQTLYMAVGAKSIEDKERGYTHPMDARNRDNRVTDEMVTALHLAVRDVAGPLTKRYYRLKAKHLSLPLLRWSDRNAPLPFTDTTEIPFEDAHALVSEAYRDFSPTLAELVESFFEKHRIDAPAVKGKRGGAFNHSLVLPGNIPASFTLLNYMGSNRDVMTLAHELGHGVHGILAGETQGPLMFHAPIAYCETASVFGEMTTFNFLKKRMIDRGDKKALLALLMGKIEDTLNTVVRQIGFSNFEQRLHGMDASYKTWGSQKKYSVEELNAIWLETLVPFYGDEGEIFTYENTEYFWSYISHFHRPFYVYGYAFGELLTQSLYATLPTLGDRFEPLYLEMLRSGATKNVKELLTPFGLDANNPAFWKSGIEVSLGAMIEEAEQLTKEVC